MNMTEKPGQLPSVRKTFSMKMYLKSLSMTLKKTVFMMRKELDMITRAGQQTLKTIKQRGNKKMEGQNKDQYFIFRDTNTERIYLEHMHAGKYQMIKDWINKKRIIYQTDNLNDPKLLETGEKEIIWDRRSTILSKHLRKIIVVFNPDDYFEMENEFKQKVFKMEADDINEKKRIDEYRREKREKTRLKKGTPEWDANIQQKIELKNITNMFITEDADEMTAMRQWKSSGFITPPPDRITEIKRTFSKMSWKQFKDFVDSIV